MSRVDNARYYSKSDLCCKCDEILKEKCGSSIDFIFSLWEVVRRTCEADLGNERIFRRN